MALLTRTVVCADASDGLGIAGMATTSRVAERRQGERQPP